MASPFLYPRLHNPPTASETTALSVRGFGFGFGLVGTRFFFLGRVGRVTRLVFFLDLPVELDPLKRLGALTEILTEVGVNVGVNVGVGVGFCRGGVGSARFGPLCNTAPRK